MNLHQKRPPLLVLGLGNMLLSDDGFGLVLLSELCRAHAPDEQIEFVDGGTLGTALLGRLEGRRALLILDAVGGGEPGEVLRIDDPLELANSGGMGAHGVNASGLLAEALLVGWLPDHVAVVGVTPSRLETGIGPSDVVRSALPKAMELAEQTLAEFRAAIEGEALCTS